MKDYKITIEIENTARIYSAKNMEKAREIAEAECDNIYARLNGRYGVSIVEIEEI